MRVRPAPTKRYFEGLPSPSASSPPPSQAGIWLASDYELAGLPGLVLAFWSLIVIAALMVSRFSYWSGKEINIRGRIPWAYALVIPLIYMIISTEPAGDAVRPVRLLRTHLRAPYWVMGAS